MKSLRYEKGSITRDAGTRVGISTGLRFSGVRAGIRIRLHGAFEKTKVRTTNVFLTLLHGTTRALHCKVVIFEKRPVEDKYLRRIALTAVQTHRHTSTLCVNDSRHSVTSRLC